MNQFKLRFKVLFHGRQCHWTIKTTKIVLNNDDRYLN